MPSTIMDPPFRRDDRTRAGARSGNALYVFSPLLGGGMGPVPADDDRPPVADYFERVVPVERRFSQASTTRWARPFSASLPQARGSYAFLLPTSPSILS